MNCREYREKHPCLTPEAQAHLAACAECRAFARSWEILKEYPPLQASPGFFQAVRRKLAPKILRFAAAISAAAAALLVVVVLTHPPPGGGPASGGVAVSEEERQILENWDLLQNYDLLCTLEMVGETRSPLGEEKK